MARAGPVGLVGGPEVLGADDGPSKVFKQRAEVKEVGASTADD